MRETKISRMAEKMGMEGENELEKIRLAIFSPDECRRMK